MGLDMYLTGDKFKCTQYAKDENGEFLRDDDGGIIPINEDTVDGFRRSSQKLDLGYWRKHAPLHQLFVNAFANGEDNCRPIELSAEDLRWVANVLKGHAATSLPSNKKVIRGCFLVAKNIGMSCVRMLTRMQGFLKKPQNGWSLMAMNIGIQFSIRRVGNERS